MKQQIEKLLTAQNIQFEFIPLPENLPLDVESHVEFHHIQLKDALPTVIFKTEKGLIAAQRRADTRIASKGLKRLAGVDSLRIATDEELESLGLKPGMVPPLGFDIPFFMDGKVLENQTVYTGSGEKLFALKMSPSDIQTINKAIVGNFSESLAGAGQHRVLSGIRASGRLHIGNYLGAVKGMLELQDDPSYETFYMVADIHAITTPYSVDDLRKNRREVIIDYLSAGLDPEKSVIFQQADNPHHAEMAFYLSSVVTIARMQHLPTFKDKVKQYPEHSTMALLNYPILMSSDILLYKADKVPVGLDQEPHLEVAREIARKMNQEYGMDFAEPTRFKTAGEYVPSLTGEGKMGKSVEGSFINLADSKDVIKQKLAKVPTDSGTIGGAVPQTGGVGALFALAYLFGGAELHQKYVQTYKDKTIRYSEMKADVTEAIYEELKPVQAKRKEYEGNPELVEQIIKTGNERATAVAAQTVREVREKMGLL
jgi:tryptophanyl-tRNA synthetase